MWLHSSLEVCSHMAFYTLSKGSFLIKLRMGLCVISGILSGSKAIIMISVY